MKKRVVVTQEQADALNAHQSKMMAASAALRSNFAELLQAARVRDELARGADVHEQVARTGALMREGPFTDGLTEMVEFQRMLASEIANGIRVVLRNREKLREVLAQIGVLEASESGSMDDVEIVVGVSNPAFSQTPAQG
jgi:uncharacterized protein Yka (UPF0111/DUF47 family)